MLKKIRNQLRVIFIGLRDLGRNFREALSLQPINKKEYKDFTFRGLYRTELSQFTRLYCAISSSKRLPWSLWLLYWLFGTRMVGVVTNKDQGRENIIGFRMFYFNRRDIEDKTIHGGFIGLLGEFRNLGISSYMRHYFDSVLRDSVRGISFRIDVDNIPSLKGALNVGYEIVEKYYDSALDIERYYLIRWFDKGNESK